MGRNGPTYRDTRLTPVKSRRETQPVGDGGRLRDRMASRHPGFWTQHPLWQKKPNGHGVPHGSPQSCCPGAHSWQRHSGGSVGLPRQISQLSQGLWQLSTISHGLHLVGSPRSASVQLPWLLFSEPSQIG